MYAFGMKSSLAIKFLFAVLSGALMGRLIQLDHERWHRLGREAFLSYQASQFDRFMASPGTGVGLIVFCVILVVGLGALYEGVAFFGTRLVSHFSPGEGPSHGNS
jgi:hypothetical protein